jgi:hypothetical protein
MQKNRNGPLLAHYRRAIKYALLLWKKSCIDLFIERLDIVLSDFCPDICPWADIAVALQVYQARMSDRQIVRKDIIA